MTLNESNGSAHSCIALSQMPYLLSFLQAKLISGLSVIRAYIFGIF